MPWAICRYGIILRRFLSHTLPLKKKLHLPSNKYALSCFCNSNINGKLLAADNSQNVRLAVFRQQHSHQNNRLPSLLYIQHPWKYLKTKLQFLRLKLFWDKSFIEKDFILGTKQAVVVLTDMIRNQDAAEIGTLTTPMGFQQITRDMVLSKNDPRLKLVQFRRDDIRKAIPVRVLFLEREGRKHCVIDMFFVGMRNVDDFDSVRDNVQMKEFLRAYERSQENRKASRNPTEEDLMRRTNDALSKVVFAEIFARFYREYSPNVPADWSVSFYKIVSFDVLAFE